MNMKFVFYLYLIFFTIQDRCQKLQEILSTSKETQSYFSNENPADRLFTVSCKEEENIVTAGLQHKDQPTSNVLEITIFPLASPGQKEDKTITKDSALQFCFSLKSNYSQDSYSYFNCSPTESKKTENSTTLEVDDKAYEPLVEEMKNMCEYVTSRLNKKIQLETLFNFLGKLKIDKEKSNLKNVVNDNAIFFEWPIVKIDKKENTFDWTLSTDSDEKISYPLKGNTGEIKKFTLVDFPLIQIILSIYDANPQFWQMSIESNKGNFETQISKFLTGKFDNEDQFLKSKYQSEIIEYLEKISGLVFAVENSQIQPRKNEAISIQASKEISIQIPEFLQKYALSDLISFPVSAFIIFDLIINHHTFAKADSSYKIVHLKNIDLSSTSEETPISAPETLQTMNTEKWFYLFNNEPLTLGSFYQEVDLDKLKEQAKEEEENSQLIFNTFLEQYQKTQMNFLELTFGIQNVHRKMVVRLYGWENMFFKSVQIQFITQYFQAEHLIPLNSFQDFVIEVNKHITEALHHLHDLVIKLDEVSVDSSVTITLQQVDQIIGNYLQEGFCRFVKEEGKKIQYKIQKTLDEKSPDFCTKDIEIKFEDQKKEGECNENLKSAVEIEYKEQSGAFNLVFNDPPKQKNAKKKSNSSNYQFYAKYPYDYLKVLQRVVRTKICHFYLGEQVMDAIEMKNVDRIFGRKPKLLIA